MFDFKSMIENDISAVFLNNKEFADSHTFDGITVDCIVDDDLLKQQAVKSGIGTYVGKKLIHVGAAVLPGRPKQDSQVEFDGKIYVIDSCDLNDGMYSITMSINEGQ